MDSANDHNACTCNLNFLPVPPSSPDALVDLYNSVLRNTLDRHAPEMSRITTLRPWYTDELRAAKREQRRYKRVYRTSRLEGIPGI